MQRLEDGQTVEIFGDEFVLEKVESFSINEWSITVYHERSDEELTDVQDHFTVEIFEIDEVTARYHNLSAHQLTSTIFNELQQLHL